MRRYWFLLICLIIIILAAIPPTRKFLRQIILGASRPVAAFLSNESMPTRSFLLGVSEIYFLQEQNAELREKLAHNQVAESQIEELRNENQILKKQIGFVENSANKELIPAKIIQREPITFLDSIVVNRGENDGVKIGQPVVSEGALVGRVSELFPGESKITLITSKNSIIQAMLQKSRNLGVLKGGISGITLENIPQDIEVAPSELVVTSGLGGGIDSGILIGEVRGERSSRAEIFKTLNIQPTVDFNRLELVFILK